MLPLRAIVDLGAIAMKGYSRISQRPSITGTSPSDRLVSYQNIRLGCLTLLQRSSRCILQLQPTGSQDTRWEGRSYPFAEGQSVYSTAPADWATGHSLEVFYPFAKKQSMYSTVPTDWATRWESLVPLQRCNPPPTTRGTGQKTEPMLCCIFIMPFIMLNS